MDDNILAQGLNGRICPQHTLHLPQHLFAFFNRCSVRLLFQCVVGRINQGQCILVEVEFDNPAFIVDRSGCAILHRLRHVININIIAKNFASVSVFCRNGCSRKAYVGCVRQGIVDDSRIANHGIRFLFALLVFLHDDFFIKAILSAVGFVCHHHNIPPLRQRTLATLKLEHRGKNDAVRLPSIQQFTQIFLAGRLNRCLAQEGCALGKLRVKLVVKINAVGHHNNGRTVQSLLQQMRIEHHRQRFSAALRVPEHTALAVRFSGDFGFLDCFPHRKILMIPRQNLELLLPIAREQDKVFQDVQQPLFLEHSLIEGVKLRIGGVLIIAILCFPLHKAVNAGSNRTRFVGGQVTDHTDCVIVEHGGNILHIVSNLVVCVFCTHFVLGRTFQFHQNQRQTIDKQNNIRAAVVSIFHEGILVYHIEIIIVCICIINQLYYRRPFFTLDCVFDRDTVLQIVHKNNILLQ